jgi:HEAT repeat protein
VLLAAVGCARPPFEYPAALNSERPDQRVAAICHACDIRDESVIPILVDRLEDEDEGVRFYAILALERLTGTRLGYEYHASEVERMRSVQRWRQRVANPSTQASGEAEK